MKLNGKFDLCFSNFDRMMVSMRSTGTLMGAEQNSLVWVAKQTPLKHIVRSTDETDRHRFETINSRRVVIVFEANVQLCIIVIGIGSWTPDRTSQHHITIRPMGEIYIENSSGCSRDNLNVLFLTCFYYLTICMDGIFIIILLNQLKHKFQKTLILGLA